MSKIFLDTNILVYIYDRHDDARHQSAVRLFGEEWVNDEKVISMQVIAEFCNVMLTKKGLIMKVPDLEFVITNVLKPLLGHVPSAEFYQGAARLYASHSLSFYDALIVQAALDLDCALLYSEDLQGGQTFGKLKVVNPFK